MPGELNWLADKAIALGVNLVLDQLGLQPDEHDGRVMVPEVAEVPGVKWLCGQDGSVITLIGRPTSGKCVSVDTPIVSASGRLIPAGDFPEGEQILSLNNDLKLEPTTVLAKEHLGVQDCLTFRFHSGRRISVTPEHPFYTVDGWQRADSLVANDYLATARTLPVDGKSSMGDHEVKVLAYLIGDGSVIHNPPVFTNGNTTIINDFLGAVSAFPDTAARPRVDKTHMRTPSYSIVAKKRWRDDLPDVDGLCYRNPEHLRQLYDEYSIAQISRAFGRAESSLDHWFAKAGIEARDARDANVMATLPNHVTELVTRCGLAGCDSYQKFVPDCIFALPNRQVALFINRLFATDGYVGAPTHGHNRTVAYYSTSRQLVLGLQHLLLRFGILSTIHPKLTWCNQKQFLSYSLTVSDADSLVVLLNEIGIVGKEAKLKRLGLMLQRQEGRKILDRIPKQVWASVQAVPRWQTGFHWSEVGHLLGYKRPKDGQSLRYHRPSRAMLDTIADMTKSRPLKLLANSDIFWDQIVEIQPEQKEVCDLTTESGNFLANDIVVHNTWLARRLAEVIGRPTYAVSPHEVPPRWIKRLDFKDILTSPPPGSTLILDDILTYMSAKMWRQQFIQEVEKMLPTARHERKLTLILCTQVTSLMDKYGLRADVICAKPPDLAYADTERPGVKRMYDRIAPVWEGRTEYWIHRHCYMITHDWEGVVRINKAKGIVETPQGQQG